MLRNAVGTLRSKNWKSCVTSVVPSINWLRDYRWKESIMSDIISGLTVAIMHIPQGMAYALLGNVPPVVGIYMAFFPVLVYFLFGTSRHVSMGKNENSDSLGQQRIRRDFQCLTKISCQ